MSAEPESKLSRLRAIVREMGSALVCYSGGVDSALVLAVAHQELGARALGLTAVSPSLAPSERLRAEQLAAQIGAQHLLREAHEIEQEGYQANGPDRCYHCKSELYRLSAEVQAERGLAFVLNGTNTDDLGDHRPGLLAASAAGARSPLVEAQMNKQDVREAARALGLPVWDKPAAACLSSRLPYGTRVTRARLQRIGAFEHALHALGLRQVRVRWHSLGHSDDEPRDDEPALARIEVAADELAAAFAQSAAIVRAGRAHGFQYVTLDLQGYRVGSHNELLPGRALTVLNRAT